jgi:hypothetical protein
MANFELQECLAIDARMMSSASNPHLLLFGNASLFHGALENFVYPKNLTY